ncbi:hypothetical protein WG66_009825 [Moniliophthora roreri]|nr:hypothetical protein WG66_009825 [Moniliophthora roreri]
MRRCESYRVTGACGGRNRKKKNPEPAPPNNQDHYIDIGNVCLAPGERREEEYILGTRCHAATNTKGHV